MIRYGLVLLLAAASWASAGITTAPRKGPDGNRFLFVVDTSSSMKPIEDSGRQVVFDLVYSGIEERMRPGDTFGVWTFGESVKMGAFPVQLWSSEKSMGLATEVSQFLKEHSNGRSSRLDAAITNIEQLIKSVKDLDVVIVTSAATRFKLDDTWAMLSKDVKARVEQAKKNNRAIIITLAGRGGQIRQATVALQGDRLQLAAPPDRRPAPVAQALPATERPKATREPIIIRGSPNARPIEEIPTKFSPPPAAPPIIETAPEPNPVPVLGTEKPLVSAPAHAAQATVAARQPGGAIQPTALPAETSTVSPRMLIIAGAALVIAAGVLGFWAMAYVRRRGRISYISQSLVNPPPEKL